MDIPIFNTKQGIPPRALSSSHGRTRGKWKPFLDQLAQLEAGCSFESHEIDYSLHKVDELKVIQTTLLFKKKKKVLPNGDINPFLGTFIITDTEHVPSDSDRAYFIMWREEAEPAVEQEPESTDETATAQTPDGLDLSILTPDELKEFEAIGQRFDRQTAEVGAEQLADES